MADGPLALAFPVMPAAAAGALAYVPWSVRSGGFLGAVHIGLAILLLPEFGANLLGAPCGTSTDTNRMQSRRSASGPEAADRRA